MIIAKNRAGLIMTEALVAISLLAVGVIVMGALINNAVSANRISKEYLLAHNLATEAIEGVKNVRDTNWLVEAGDSGCWLRMDPANGDCGTPGDQAQNGENYIPTELNGAWSMVPSPAGGDLDLTTKTNMAAYSILFDEDSLRYYDFATGVVLPGASESGFYRSIRFISVTPISALFEVRMQWISESQVRTVDRQMMLYNYF